MILGMNLNRRDPAVQIVTGSRSYASTDTYVDIANPNPGKAVWAILGYYDDTATQKQWIFAHGDHATLTPLEANTLNTAPLTDALVSTLNPSSTVAARLGQIKGTAGSVHYQLLYCN